MCTVTAVPYSCSVGCLRLGKFILSEFGLTRSDIKLFRSPEAKRALVHDVSEARVGMGGEGVSVSLLRRKHNANGMFQFNPNTAGLLKCKWGGLCIIEVWF